MSGRAENLAAGISLYPGDCLDVLKTLESDSVDSVVSDPPYGLEFMGKGWDGADGFRRSLNAADAERDNVFGRTSRKGPEYRATELFQQFMHAAAVELLRVLKPGGHLLMFGGTRTYHRMVCAIEDAGFEIRDQIGWLFGQGFPKSLDVSKAIDKLDAVQARLDRQFRFTEWMRSTGLKASRIDALTGTAMGNHYTTHPTQPSVATRDLFEMLRPHFGCDVPQWVEEMVDERTVESENFKRREVLAKKTYKRGEEGTWTEHTINDGSLYAAGEKEHVTSVPYTDAAHEWQGWGTALKPAWEPICIARKPLIGTVAENVQKYGTGAINVDGCRVDYEDTANAATNPLYRVQNGYRTAVGSDAAGSSFSVKPNGGNVTANTKGRWPANIIHDGSEEVLAAFPDNLTSGTGAVKRSTGEGYKANAYGAESRPIGTPNVEYGDSGSAARFFYTAKADADDRLGSKHPTVKPVDPMQWLVRLVTPKRVLYCPNCDTLRNGQNSTEKAGSDTPVCVVSEGLQTEGQSTHREVLQPPMCGGVEGAATEAVRVVRNDISAQEGRREEMLQPLVRGEVDGEEQKNLQGICNQQGGLQASLDAGPPAVTRPEGLHIRAPLGDAATDRKTANARRSGASHKRRQIGQSPGESATHAQGRSRQAESPAPEHADVPPLQREDHHQPTCPHCGHSLEYRPGICLDPFAGTGTTGEAAFREGMRAILIEREPEYQDDIRRRMRLMLAGPEERSREAIKAKMKDKPVDHGPLFASGADT